jgi:hypothetical protein
LYTERCAISPREGKQRWPRPSRLVAAGAEHALGYTPPRQPRFTASEYRSHRGEAANRALQRVETHFLPALLRMNELVEEYLRRIHQAGGVPTEQAIDTTDASPRSRPLGVHFTTPLPRQGEM